MCRSAGRQRSGEFASGGAGRRGGSRRCPVVRPTRSTWRVHQGYTAGAQCHPPARWECTGLAMPVVWSTCRACGRIRLGGARAVVSCGREPGARGASACGFRGLYGPVRGCPQDRRRGGPGARTYSGQRCGRGCHGRLFPQVRGYMEVQGVAVCKTVGSAYVGSNPTPATTCENGPSPLISCRLRPYSARCREKLSCAAGRGIPWRRSFRFYLKMIMTASWCSFARSCVTQSHVNA